MLQTAEHTAALFSLTVLSEQGLIDVDCGKWPGFSPNEVCAKWPAEYEKYLHDPLEFQFPGSESLEGARLRAFQRVNELAETHSGKTVMLVSHTALNRLILLSVFGMNSSGFWEMCQDTCAINMFEIESGLFTLHLLNETSHLFSLLTKRMQEPSRTI
jgi:probable phosphoglycerate mutase